MKLATLVLFSLIFSATAQAEIIDINELSQRKLSKILDDVDVKVRISNSDIQEDDEARLTFHIQKYVQVIFMPGQWETNSNCSLEKSGNNYECTMEGVDMANYARPLKFNNYYELVVHSGRKYFCEDIPLHKEDLKIEKKGSWFPDYTLIIDMKECDFRQ